MAATYFQIVTYFHMVKDQGQSIITCRSISQSALCYLLKIKSFHRLILLSLVQTCTEVSPLEYMFLIVFQVIELKVNVWILFTCCLI